MVTKKTVLVVDDDQIHLYTTSELLKSDQVDVVTHLGSFGATNILKSIKPDLLLLDINMPGLSGSYLSDILKPHCEGMKVPIVFYSSNDEDMMKELVEEKGVQGYICKGDPDALRSTVHKFLQMLK